MKKILHYFLGNLMCAGCGVVLNKEDKTYMIEKKFYCKKCKEELNAPNL